MRWGEYVVDFKLKLDVGCGAGPTGDVNVDRYTGFSPHTVGKIEPRRIKNFVKAEGCHLPFRDCSFEEVYSSHLIEHLPNPFTLVKELARVAKAMGTIEIRCPHKCAWGRKELIQHVSKFDENWFRAVANKLGLTILALDLTWMPIGFRIGFFHVRPFAKAWGIQVSMRKTTVRLLIEPQEAFK